MSKQLDEIRCPQCGHVIPISEALRHQLTEEFDKRIEKEVSAAVASKEVELKKCAEEAVSVDLRDMQAQLQETQEKLRTTQAAEHRRTVRGRD